MFGFRLYSPFPGTAAYYNIGSRLWIKLLKPLLCFMSCDFLNALFLPTTVLSTQFIPNNVIYPKSAQIASSSPSSLCLLLLDSHIRFQFVTSDTNFIAKNSTFGVCEIYHFYWKPLRIWNYNLYSGFSAVSLDFCSFVLQWNPHWYPRECQTYFHLNDWLSFPNLRYLSVVTPKRAIFWNMYHYWQ